MADAGERLADSLRTAHPSCAPPVVGRTGPSRPRCLAVCGASVAHPGAFPHSVVGIEGFRHRITTRAEANHAWLHGLKAAPNGPEEIAAVRYLLPSPSGTTDTVTRKEPLMTVPAGHSCILCGARVESRTIDWADEEGSGWSRKKLPCSVTCVPATQGTGSLCAAVVGSGVEGVTKAFGPRA
jgi:hypothetical protein